MTTRFPNGITATVTGNVTGNITGDITGDVTGNVTGNVTGDVTGDLTGNVTGNVTGDVTGDVTGNVTGAVLETTTAVTADGAVAVPSFNTTFMITKAGVAAMTLVDPTTVTHDGLRVKFIAATANAHTLDNSAGSGFNAAGAAGDVGTFGGAIGDNIELVAYGGVWHITANTNVTVA